MQEFIKPYNRLISTWMELSVTIRWEANIPTWFSIYSKAFLVSLRPSEPFFPFIFLMKIM
jgi:hypothetical protein